MEDMTKIIFLISFIILYFVNISFIFGDVKKKYHFENGEVVEND